MFPKIHDKDTEKSLKQLKEFLNAGFSFLKLDENGTISYVNATCCQSSKYTHQELIGSSFDVILSSNPQNLSFEQVLKFIKKGKKWTKTIRIQDKNEKFHWFKTFLTPFFDDNGELKEIYVLMVEVSEFVEAKNITRTQVALYHIIEITNRDISTKVMLEECLDVLLHLPWLKTKSQGGFIRKAEGKENLEIITHKGLAAEQLGVCDLVKNKTSPCQVAIQTKKIIYTASKANQVWQQKNNIAPHGSYHVPILWGERVMGMLFLHLEVGYKKRQKDKDFLNIVSESIGGALFRREMQEKQAKYLKTQESQAILYQIIATANKPIEEKELLTACLKILLDIDWLKIEDKGAIFFKEAGKDELNLIVHRHLGLSLLKMCNKVAYGRCLCGIAAQRKEFMHSSCVDENHHNHPAGMQPHGHYNIPILWRDEVLGVIVLYLEHGHKKIDFEVNFLKSVAETMASAIARKRNYKQLLLTKNELEEHNHELKALNENAIKSHNLLEKQTQKLSSQQDDVLASITYAKKIQRALLPLKSKFADLFEDSFIFDKARDIVGGDFCWFLERDNFSFVILADCTGHGVPGAFMTVIANNIINDVIRDRGYIIPNQILDSLDIGIKKALNQNKTKNNDGMDLALALIDKENKKIYFSGAKSSLFCLNPKGELSEIKGARKSIGGSQIFKREASFTMEIIDFEKNSWFYMSSDGYRDQFGGENVKFGKKRFLNLLQSLHGLNGKEQYLRLEKVLANWSGSESQIDDILCLGFSL